MKNALRFTVFALACMTGVAAHAVPLAICKGHADTEKTCRSSNFPEGSFKNWISISGESHLDGFYVHRIVKGRESDQVMFVPTDANLKKGDHIEFVVVGPAYVESYERHFQQVKEAKDAELEAAAAAKAADGGK